MMKKYSNQKNMMYRIAGIALLILIVAGSSAQSQSVRPSQKGTVSQQVAQTEISLVYSRPVAKGRALFGALVPYDEIWGGANEATTFEISDDVNIEGQTLAAGRYSIWWIPGAEEWTIIFSKKADVWHTRYPSGEDALRVTVTPKNGDHMEVMALYFPVVGPDSATLVMHWGETIVPISITL
jgi:hypothetical protein